MACSDQISTQDLINAKDDAVTLGEVATSRLGAESSGTPITTSTNRFGETTDTIQGRLNKLGVLFDDPIKDWSASLLVDDLRAHRYPATTGDIYIPVKPLPFTTGGSFNTDDWVILQGVIENELESRSFDLLSSAVNSSTLNPAGGQEISIKERVSGGGSLIGDTVLASGVTPNGIDIIQCVGVALLAIVIRTDLSMPDGFSTAEISATNLVDATGWSLGTYWSGTYAGGFTHTPPLTDGADILQRTVAVNEDSYYEVSIRVTSPFATKVSNSGWTVSLGGSPDFEMFEGTFTDHIYVRGIKAGAGGDIVITPENLFDGTLLEISVKEITGDTTSTTKYVDESGATSLEVRPLQSDQENVMIGKDNAMKNTTGLRNVAVGVRSMQTNTTGFWNVAIGHEALQLNNVGSRNVALGTFALRDNQVGHRNISLGSFSQLNNISGHNNIAIGADVLQRNETGFGNIGIGLANLSGDEVAVNLIGNVAIGYNCMTGIATDYNIAMGFEAGSKLKAGNEQIVIGKQSLRENTDGSRNIVIGHNSLNSVDINSPLRNVVVGTNVGNSSIDPQFNVLLGNNCAASLTTADSNIIIGYNIDVVSATTSFQLNIGNVIHGRMGASDRRIGIDVTVPTAKMHLAAGENKTFGASLKLDTGVLMATPEGGAIEYDGTNLYFTDSTNTRRTITFT
jgi:hypothetical protein